MGSMDHRWCGGLWVRRGPVAIDASALARVHPCGWIWPGELDVEQRWARARHDDSGAMWSILGGAALFIRWDGERRANEGGDRPAVSGKLILSVLEWGWEAMGQHSFLKGGGQGGDSTLILHGTRGRTVAWRGRARLHGQKRRRCWFHPKEEKKWGGPRGPAG
jgi:hypothetical protein